MTNNSKDGDSDIILIHEHLHKMIIGSISFSIKLIITMEFHISAIMNSTRFLNSRQMNEYGNDRLVLSMIPFVASLRSNTLSCVRAFHIRIHHIGHDSVIPIIKE